MSRRIESAFPSPPEFPVPAQAAILLRTAPPQMSIRQGSKGSMDSLQPLLIASWSREALQIPQTELYQSQRETKAGKSSAGAEQSTRLSLQIPKSTVV